MSAFKKSLLVAGVAMILSNNVFADEGHGIVGDAANLLI